MTTNINYQSDSTQIVIGTDEALSIVGLFMICIVLSHAFGRAAKK